MFSIEAHLNFVRRAYSRQVSAILATQSAANDTETVNLITDATEDFGAFLAAWEGVTELYDTDAFEVFVDNFGVDLNDADDVTRAVEAFESAYIGEKTPEEYAFEMSNTVYDIVNVRVCQTCVIAFENGDTSGLTSEENDKWTIGVERRNLLSNGWEWSGVQCDNVSKYGNTCECEDDLKEHPREGRFSWLWCECCGDTDGGDRWNVAIMRRIV